MRYLWHCIYINKLILFSNIYDQWKLNWHFFSWLFVFFLLLKAAMFWNNIFGLLISIVNRAGQSNFFSHIALLKRICFTKIIEIIFKPFDRSTIFINFVLTQMRYNIAMRGRNWIFTRMTSNPNILFDGSRTFVAFQKHCQVPWSFYKSVIRNSHKVILWLIIIIMLTFFKFYQCQTQP